MIKDIHSAGLTVANLEAAIAYYCATDAYELLEQFHIPNTEQARAAYGLANAEGKSALLRGHGAFLELTEFQDSIAAKEDSRRVHDAGIRHICIRTEDANQHFDAHAAAGASWHARPHDLGTGLEYAYIRDPEGNLLELEGLPMMPPGLMKPWFDHVAIVTPDIQRLANFYEQLTGAKLSRSESFGPEKKFDTVAGIDGIVFDGAWILFGLSRIEMWQYQNPETKPCPPPAANEIGWSHFCIEVGDIDAEQQRLSDLGVTFLGDIQSSVMGRSILLRDVDGNLVKLLQVAEERPEFSMDSLASRPILEQIRAVSEGNNKGN